MLIFLEVIERINTHALPGDSGVMAQSMEK